MTRRYAVTLAVTTCLSVSIVGCGGNDVSGPTAPSSPPAQSGNRNVRFEATGTFSGRSTAAFTLANGATTVEDIPSLPWTKDITYAQTVLGTGLVVSGSGGVAGQTMVLRVLVGGSQVSSTPGTALTGGVLTVSTPPYLF